MHVEQLPVEGRDLTRTVWFAAGPDDAAHALCVFLDGEYYLERMGARAILENGLASGRLPPMSVAFVPSNGPASRHEELVCNERFARYVAIDLVRWAKQRVPSLRTDGHLVCGVSLSGLASAHLALTHPRVFSSSLSQSGSFWWREQHFATLARSLAPFASRHWLSVGDLERQEKVAHPPTGIWQEASQVVGVQSAVDALRAGGAEVHHHLFHGGHDFAPWAAELGDALAWLAGDRS